MNTPNCLGPQNWFIQIDLNIFIYSTFITLHGDTMKAKLLKYLMGTHCLEPKRSVPD